jgi:hypothetical protein
MKLTGFNSFAGHSYSHSRQSNHRYPGVCVNKPIVFSTVSCLQGIIHVMLQQLQLQLLRNTPIEEQRRYRKAVSLYISITHRRVDPVQA